MRAFLVTTAKNEAPYFLEWVAHHLELGFTDIVIFQNDSDDLTHETLFALRKIGAIRYFYNRAENRQIKTQAYTRADSFPEFKDCDWAMALDMNEFLVVKTGNGTLTDLIAAVPESDCLHLNRRDFGNSGFELLTDELVTDRFCMADHPLGPTENASPYKCLFRPSLFQRPGIHHPEKPVIAPEAIRYTNGSGLRPDHYRVKSILSTDICGCEFAQINHYITRDLTSFLLKSTENSDMKADRRTVLRHWKKRNKNFEIDGSMAPWQARTIARMNALDEASDGQLMELRQTAIYTHLSRYYTMLQKPAMRDFRDRCKAHPNAVNPHTDHAISSPPDLTGLAEMYLK
ncbi:glycosyltransferase family 2 protein [Pseudorhodobacter turbinis]|nr:glycosyltransferase family 2 protein [Pseudorhodobacter turbinis]